MSENQKSADAPKNPPTPDSIANDAARHVERVFANNQDGSATSQAFAREIHEHPQEAQAIWKAIAAHDAATDDSVEKYLAGSWAQDQFGHHPGDLGDDIRGLTSDQLASAANPASPPTTDQGIIGELSAQWLIQNKGSVSASAAAAVETGLNTDTWYIAPSEASAIASSLDKTPGWNIKPPPDQPPTWGDYFKRVIGATGASQSDE
jgi:hypothetical protein